MAHDPIRSLQNPRVKHAVRMRDARYRRRTQQLIIDGPREVIQAYLGGLTFTEIFVDESSANLIAILGEHVPAAIEIDWRELDAKVTRVASPVMEKLGYGDRAPCVVAIAEQPILQLDSLDARLNKESRRRQRDGCLVLVIDRIEKPGNLGAMLRTADAVGVDCVLLGDPMSEIWNPNAIRASLGAIFRVPMAMASALEIVGWLQARGYEIFAARVQASRHHFEMVWPSMTAIVVGSEAEGLGEPWVCEGIRGVRLPMQGSVDSLNVSVSAAVLLYHAALAKNWFPLP